MKPKTRKKITLAMFQVSSTICQKIVKRDEITAQNK